MHTKIYTYLLTLDNLSEILSEFQEFGEKLHFSNYGGVLFTVTTLGASLAHSNVSVTPICKILPFMT